VYLSIIFKEKTRSHRLGLLFYLLSDKMKGDFCMIDEVLFMSVLLIGGIYLLRQD
jgi:hypothetical protein